jgi:prepilin-type N-terminal cleavage/methylation domain-containing protein
MFRRDAFSLVELLLVIVITGIIGALVLLNMTSKDAIDVQVEARNMVRSIHSLRSAWLDYHADKFTLLGVPDFDINDPSFVASLEVYADRSFSDEIGRYGSVDIVTRRINASNFKQHVYIGFRPNSSSTFGVESGLRNRVIDVLKSSNFLSLYGLVKADGTDYTGQAGEPILIRVW